MSIIWYEEQVTQLDLDVYGAGGGVTIFWSNVLRVGLLSILLMTLSWRAGLAAGTAIPRNEPGSVTEKTDTPKEDDRLPIYKKGWEFFLAPYLWIPGATSQPQPPGQF